MFINFASSSAPSLTLNYLKSATSTIPSNTNYAWSIATSTTAPPIFSISTLGSGASLNATTTINGGFNLNNGALVYDYSSDITTINALEAGPMNFDNNAGIVSWIDLGITSASAVDTKHSYTAQIASNPVLTVYGESDGAGTAKNLRIGIGTTTPLNKLTIHNATTTANSDLGFTATSTGLTSWYNWTMGIDISDGGKFKISSSTALGTSDRFVIDGQGNVGISTSSPNWKLSVAGTGSFDDYVRVSYFTATSTTATSTFAWGIQTTALDVTSTTATSTFANGIQLSSGCFRMPDGTCVGGAGDPGVSTFLALTDTDPVSYNAGRVFFTNSGATGIADSSNFTFDSTSNKLTVSYASTTALSITGGLLDFTSANATTTLKNNSPFAWTIATTTAGTASSTLLRIDTTSGSEQVIVGTGYGSLETHGKVIIGDVGAPSDLEFEESSLIHGQGANTLTFGSSGDIVNFRVNTSFGAASSTPWRALSVDGTVALKNLTSSTAGNALCILSTNDVVNAGGATCATSARRFKENIETLSQGFALDKLDKLRVVSFDYKEGAYSPEDPRGSYGLIAEEVEQVDPKLVDYGYDGLPITLKFERIMGLTVQAIQELNLNLATIASTTASTTPQSESFASSLFNNIFTRVTGWLADAANGIGDVFAGTFRAKEKICVDDQCLTKDDVRSLINLARNSGGQANVSGSANNNTSNPPAVSSSSSSFQAIGTGNSSSSSSSYSSQESSVSLFQSLSETMAAQASSSSATTTDTSISTPSNSSASSSSAESSVSSDSNNSSSSSEGSNSSLENISSNSSSSDESASPMTSSELSSESSENSSVSTGNSSSEISSSASSADEMVTNPETLTDATQ